MSQSCSRCHGKKGVPRERRKVCQPCLDEPSLATARKARPTGFNEERLKTAEWKELSEQYPTLVFPKRLTRGSAEKILAQSGIVREGSTVSTAQSLAAKAKGIQRPDQVSWNPKRLSTKELDQIRQENPGVAFPDRASTITVARILGAVNLIPTVTVTLWTPDSQEKQEENRKMAEVWQAAAGDSTAAPLVGTRTKYNPFVYEAVMARTTITSADRCERPGCNRVLEKKENGEPLGEHHHMLSVKTSDTVSDSARICPICHSTITRSGVNGQIWNGELIRAVASVEIPIPEVNEYLDVVYA